MKNKVKAVMILVFILWSCAILALDKKTMKDGHSHKDLADKMSLKDTGDVLFLGGGQYFYADTDGVYILKRGSDYSAKDKSPILTKETNNIVSTAKYFNSKFNEVKIVDKSDVYAVKAYYGGIFVLATTIDEDNGGVKVSVFKYVTDRDKVGFAGYGDFFIDTDEYVVGAVDFGGDIDNVNNSRDILAVYTNKKCYYINDQTLEMSNTGAVTLDNSDSFVLAAVCPVTFNGHIWVACVRTSQKPTIADNKVDYAGCYSYKISMMLFNGYNYPVSRYANNSGEKYFGKPKLFNIPVASESDNFNTHNIGLGLCYQESDGEMASPSTRPEFHYFKLKNEQYPANSSMERIAVWHADIDDCNDDADNGATWYITNAEDGDYSKNQNCQLVAMYSEDSDDREYYSAWIDLYYLECDESHSLAQSDYSDWINMYAKPIGYIMGVCPVDTDIKPDDLPSLWSDSVVYGTKESSGSSSYSSNKVGGGIGIGAGDNGSSTNYFGGASISTSFSHSRMDRKETVLNFNSQLHVGTSKAGSFGWKTGLMLFSCPTHLEWNSYNIYKNSSLKTWDDSPVKMTALSVVKNLNGNCQKFYFDITQEHKKDGLSLWLDGLPIVPASNKASAWGENEIFHDYLSYVDKKLISNRLQGYLALGKISDSVYLDYSATHFESTVNIDTWTVSENIGFNIPILKIFNISGYQNYQWSYSTTDTDGSGKSWGFNVDGKTCKINEGVGKFNVNALYLTADIVPGDKQFWINDRTKKCGYTPWCITYALTEGNPSELNSAVNFL